MEGFLLIDKPVGPTSHDIVDQIRRLIGLRQVGHAGTLDPFASGLLIIGVDRATKEMNKLVGLDKEYLATLKLGAVTDTYDRTGKVTARQDIKISEMDIKKVLKKFTGQIQQIPPMYSAKKVNGKKLYELARAGIEIERQPISITIYSIDLISESPSTPYYTSTSSVSTGQASSSNILPERSDSGVEGPPLLKIKVHCSSGTYIRSLAHDIGQTLGCGAYLEELRRTMIGPFRVEEASNLSTLNKENIISKIHSISEIIGKL